MRRTPEQIRSEGLAALRKQLGRAGTLRFLQQFERGAGDYVSQRRKWVDKTTLDDIKKLAAKRKRNNRRKA